MRRCGQRRQACDRAEPDAAGAAGLRAAADFTRELLGEEVDRTPRSWCDADKAYAVWMRDEELNGRRTPAVLAEALEDVAMLVDLTLTDPPFMAERLSELDQENVNIAEDSMIWVMEAADRAEANS